MRILAALIMALAAQAATTRTVTVEIRDSSNALATGSATIRLTGPCTDTSDNRLTMPTDYRVSISAGVLSASLQQTTLCAEQPEPTYRVRYTIPGDPSPERVEYWSVGWTGSAVSLQRLQNPPVNWLTAVFPLTKTGLGIGLADSPVTPGTYGSGTNVPIVTVDRWGRVTSASTTPVVGGGGTPGDPGEGLEHSILQYGGAADGTTDNSPAIAAALADADVVYFPQCGTYRINSTITLAAGQSLIGIAPAADWRGSTSCVTLSYYGSTRAVLIQPGTGTVFGAGAIQNIEINGANATGSADGVFLNCAATGANCEGFNLLHSSIKDFPRYQLHLDGNVFMVNIDGSTLSNPSRGGTGSELLYGGTNGAVNYRSQVDITNSRLIQYAATWAGRETLATTWRMSGGSVIGVANGSNGLFVNGGLILNGVHMEGNGFGTASVGVRYTGALQAEITGSSVFGWHDNVQVGDPTDGTSRLQPALNATIRGLVGNHTSGGSEVLIAHGGQRDGCSIGPLGQPNGSPAVITDNRFTIDGVEDCMKQPSNFKSQNIPGSLLTSKIEDSVGSATVRFSTKSATAPAKVGTSLPAACTVGDQFFKSDATAGQNLYGCTATNTWTLQAGGGGGGSGITSLGGQTGATQTFAAVDDTNIDLTVSSASNVHTITAAWLGLLGKSRMVATTVHTDQGNTFSTGGQDFSAASYLTVPVGAGAAPTANGRIAYDSTANRYKAGANGSTKTFATIDGNIATASALDHDPAACPGGQYASDIDATGALTCSTPAGGSGVANNSFTLSGTSTAFTHSYGAAELILNCVDSADRPIEVQKITRTTSTVTVITKLAAVTGDKCYINGSGGGGGGGSGDTIVADTGILVTTVGSTKHVGIDPAIIPTKLTGSASLDFSSISQSACPELTFTVTGATTGDAVSEIKPGTLEAGLVVDMRVTAADTVTARVCKITSGSVDPANQTFGAVITR